MYHFFSSDHPHPGEEAADIEKYRTHRRRMGRGQPDATLNSHIEDLDVENGRARKVPAKWRQQKQQQVLVSNQLDWNAEMTTGFNAFDFSASPEAFDETECLQQNEGQALSCEDNQQSERQPMAHDAIGKSDSLWERRSLDRRQTSKAVQQLPTLGQDALWGGPMHYATQDAQRQALYFQPQYFA